MFLLFPIVRLAVIGSQLDGNYLGIEGQGILVRLLVHVRHIGVHHCGGAAYAKITNIILFAQHGA